MAFHGIKFDPSFNIGTVNPGGTGYGSIDMFRNSPSTPSGSSGYPGAALLGVSAFSTMFGSLLDAKAAKQNAKATAAAARYNAALAELEANRNAYRIRLDNRRRSSSEFVQMAAKSGVLAEQGGWLNRVVDNYGQREMAALDEMYRGRNAATLERYRARTALRQGKRSSAAAILSGVSSVAQMGLSLYAGGKGP